jgi:hypothetical protein
MNASHRRLNTQLHKVMRASSLLLAFFVVRSAEAGEQLSIAQLVKEADAVALVDNTLRSSVAIRRWLGGTEPRAPFTLESPLCIPDKDMLLRWQSSHKNHAGAPTWQRTLAVGHADQLVFFKLYQGVWARASPPTPTSRPRSTRSRGDCATSTRLPSRLPSSTPSRLRSARRLRCPHPLPPAQGAFERSLAFHLKREGADASAKHLVTARCFVGMKREISGRGAAGIGLVDVTRHAQRRDTP